jgi:hypothetical protein
MLQAHGDEKHDPRVGPPGAQKDKGRLLVSAADPILAAAFETPSLAQGTN